MSSNPVDHVKDIPYFAISEEYRILLPKISGSGHEVSVDWGGEVLGGPDRPAYFTVQTFSLVVVSVLLLHYAQGSTAIEAYWKSVLWPSQGVFVGEPLATPFSRSDVR